MGLITCLLRATQSPNYGVSVICDKSYNFERIQSRATRYFDPRTPIPSLFGDIGWIFLNTLGGCTYVELGIVMLVREPNLKKCVIKGDNWSVKGPTKNLYILNAEVVQMTVLGGVFPNQWEYYGLP